MYLGCGFSRVSLRAGVPAPTRRGGRINALSGAWVSIPLVLRPSISADSREGRKYGGINVVGCQEDTGNASDICCGARNVSNCCQSGIARLLVDSAARVLLQKTSQVRITTLRTWVGDI